jgi:hypothetical protein
VGRAQRRLVHDQRRLALTHHTTARNDPVATEHPSREGWPPTEGGDGEFRGPAGRSADNTGTPTAPRPRGGGTFGRPRPARPGAGSAPWRQARWVRSGPMRLRTQPATWLDRAEAGRASCGGAFETLNHPFARRATAARRRHYFAPCVARRAEPEARAQSKAKLDGLKVPSVVYHLKTQPTPQRPCSVYSDGTRRPP